MAVVNIAINCGCGFRAQTIEEAIKHVDEKKHTLDILGSVKPSAHAIRGVSTSVSPHLRKTSVIVSLLQLQPEEEVDFSKLRARIQKR